MEDVTEAHKARTHAARRLDSEAAMQNGKRQESFIKRAN